MFVDESGNTGAGIFLRNLWSLISSYQGRFVIVFLSLISVLAAFPLVDHFAEGRSAALLLQAQAAAEMGDWVKAERLASAASFLAPRNVSAARLAVGAALRLGRKPFPTVTDRLFESGSAATGDRLLALTADFLTDQPERFWRKILALPHAERQSDEVTAMEAGVLVREGSVDDAVRLAEANWKTKGSAIAGLLYAETLFEKNPIPERHIGELLAEILRDGKPGAGAALGQLWRLSPQVIERLSLPRDLPAWIEARPEATAVDRVAALDIEVLRNPHLRTELIEQAVAWAKASPSPQLLAWLLAANQLDRVRELLPERGSEADPYLVVRVNLHVAEGELARAGELLESSSRQEIPAAQSALMMADLARRELDFEGERGWWRVALDEAAQVEDGEALIEVIRAARSVDRGEIAATGVLKAMRKPAARRLSREELLESMAFWSERGSFEPLLQIALGAEELFPADPDFRNNAAYLRALARDVSPEDAEALETLVVRHPFMPAYRTTLALILLRSGRPGEALEVLDRGEQTNVGKLLKAAALENLGDSAGARELARSADESRLLPEERALLP